MGNLDGSLNDTIYRIPLGAMHLMGVVPAKQELLVYDTGFLFVTNGNLVDVIVRPATRYVVMPRTIKVWYGLDLMITQLHVGEKNQLAQAGPIPAAALSINQVFGCDVQLDPVAPHEFITIKLQNESNLAVPFVAVVYGSVRLIAPALPKQEG